MNSTRKDHQPVTLAAWENDDGAAPSDSGLTVETEREKSVERGARRDAFDAAYESSVRGEHRYPDAHQTDAEQRARQARDELKRKLHRGL